MTTYDRPVEAKLVVQLANGESWDATEADLDRFGLVRTQDAYIRFHKAVSAALVDAGLARKDVTSARLNSVADVVSTAISHPDLMGDEETLQSIDDIVAIERLLQGIEGSETEETVGPDAAVRDYLAHLAAREG